MGGRILPVAEAQAIGWYDDGSEEGAQRTVQVRSGLAYMPFRTGQYDVSGSASNEYPLFKEDIHRYNADGSGSGFNATIAAGGPTGATHGYLTFAFTGRVLGLRWLKGYVSSGYPVDFSCIIDGMVYQVNNHFYDPWNGYSSEANRPWFGNYCEIVADDLDDGVHYCRLVFNSNTDQTNRWILLGYAVEERYGVLEQPRRISMCNAQSITGTTLGTAQVPDLSHHGESSPENTANGVHAIAYSNAHSGDVTITLCRKYNNSATPEPIKTLTLAAGAADIVTFPAPLAIDVAAGAGKCTLAHYASVTAVVKAVVIGGM